MVHLYSILPALPRSVTCLVINIFFISTSFQISIINLWWKKKVFAFFRSWFLWICVLVVGPSLFHSLVCGAITNKTLISVQTIQPCHLTLRTPGVSAQFISIWRSAPQHIHTSLSSHHTERLVFAFFNLQPSLWWCYCKLIHICCHLMCPF